MSGFREKFEFVFDVTGNKQAAKAFTDIGKGADAAGTKLGKISGKFSEIAGSAGAQAAAAAVVAVGTAAIAAVGKFEKLGVAVGRFSDATKLSTEDSSRWIEVAQDLGIGADTVQTAIGKMEKALATTPAKFEELGVAIAHTAGGAVDVQGTFLNTIDTINRMEDPLARSKVASELFGKSWQSMSELIGMGSAKIKTALGDVAGAKVLSPEEVAKAKAYREAMDKLHDAFEELVLTVGEELIPALTTVADTLGTIAKVGVPVAKHVSEIISAASGGKADGLHRAAADILMFGTPEVTRGLRKVASMVGGEVSASFDLAAGKADNFSAEAWKMRDAGLALVEVWAKEADAHDARTAAYMRGNHAQEEFNATMAQTAKDADRAAKALTRIDEAWGRLTDNIDNAQSKLDLDEAFKNLPKNEQEVLALRRQVKDFAKDVLKVPPSVGVKLDAMIDRGAYDRAKALLDALTAYRIVPFEPQLTTTTLGGKKVFATGGNIGTDGGVVGDAGPEWFQPASAGRIFTSGELARAMNGGSASGGGGMTVVLNQTISAGANPAEVGRQTVEAIKQYERMAGSGWRN